MRWSLWSTGKSLCFQTVGEGLDHWIANQKLKKELKPMPVGSYTAGAIVLLSDGRRTTGPDPMEAAQYAANRGVRVYTVAFGTPDGFIPGMEGYTFYTKVDEETLQAIAKVTGGEFFKASNANDLKMIYQNYLHVFQWKTRNGNHRFVCARLCSPYCFIDAFIFDLVSPTQSNLRTHASLKMPTESKPFKPLQSLKSARITEGMDRTPHRAFYALWAWLNLILASPLWAS